MTGKSAKKEWIILQCFDAYHSKDGKPGSWKEPVPGYDVPMTREKALAALREIEQKKPDEDFSMRKVASVTKLPGPK